MRINSQRTFDWLLGLKEMRFDADVAAKLIHASENEGQETARV